MRRNVPYKFIEPSMGPPYWCTFVVWRPDNSVNIWNLLWLSRRLIIFTEQTNIYINTFPNTLTSQMAKDHDINIHVFDKRDRNYVTHRQNSEIQNALVFKRRTLLS